MARSLKKGPFADPHLLKKIEAQADSEKKSVIKTWTTNRCFTFTTTVWVIVRVHYRTTNSWAFA